MNYIGLDLSTKTGFVQLNEKGEVLAACEISYKKKDPERMVSLIDDIMDRVDIMDMIVIEDFGFNSRQGFLLGGIGWGVRMEMFRREIEYKTISPAGLKKFVSGKGNANKDQMAVDIYKRWGFEDKSDNVRDAYALAQVGRSLHDRMELTKFQKEALERVG